MAWKFSQLDFNFETFFIENLMRNLKEMDIITYEKVVNLW